MLPATIFRQLSRQRKGLCKGLTELVTGGNPLMSSSNVINCLNRYAAATGFIRISLLNINQYRNWDVELLRLYAGRKKQYLHLQTLKGKIILQDAIVKQRESLIERKNVLVEDIREAQFMVKERVREKMEEVIERENIMTIPNMLTVSRMLLAPYIGYEIIDCHYVSAISLLAIAGITDWVSRSN